jgi:hypothetical protein
MLARLLPQGDYSLMTRALVHHQVGDRLAGTLATVLHAVCTAPRWYACTMWQRWPRRCGCAKHSTVALRRDCLPMQRIDTRAERLSLGATT